MTCEESSDRELLPIQPEAIYIPRSLGLSTRDIKGLWYPYEDRGRPTDTVIAEACHYATGTETYRIVGFYGEYIPRSLGQDELIKRLMNVGVNKSLAYTAAVNLARLSYFTHISLCPFYEKAGYLGIVRKFTTPQPPGIPYEIIVLPCQYLIIT